MQIAIIILLSIVLLKQLFIIHQLFHLKNQNKKIMSKQELMDAALAEINDATNAISARIDAFIAANADNVSAESLAQLQADADALKAIGTPATDSGTQG